MCHQTPVRAVLGTRRTQLRVHHPRLPDDVAICLSIAPHALAFGIEVELQSVQCIDDQR
jgi:hypothetical protein